jgi:alpha-1,3-rhamnosyl/mannosyltransferase
VPFLAPGLTLTVVHDLAFERFPRAYTHAALAYLRLTTRWAELRCPRLLTVSEATAHDLAELHGVAPERITVAHPGGGEPPASSPAPADTRRRLAALGVDRPFVLHVGRVEPRKNQLTALRAVLRLPDLLLVVAGPLVDEGMVATLRASDRCRVLGLVAGDDLEALYASAEALVFPSLYEGFGIPVLEAMRRGLPVVTARVASLPEVGGDAALYVDDPNDAEGLAAALEQALDDRDRLRRLGLEQAARFTWDRTASSVAGVMREMLS